MENFSRLSRTILTELHSRNVVSSMEKLRTYLDLLEEKLDPTAKEIKLMSEIDTFLLNLNILENSLSQNVMLEDQSSSSDVLDRFYNSCDKVYSIDDDDF